MSKLPTIVTYLVGIDHGAERALCVEASSMIRLTAFRRRCGVVRTVRQPFGVNYHGKHLSPSAQTVLTRQLYRHMKVVDPVGVVVTSRVYGAYPGSHRGVELRV